MTAWRDARAYVELALAIQEHMPGFVDSYFGPPDLAQEARTAGKVNLALLQRRADILQSSLRSDADLTEPRKDVLAGELLAMQTMLRILSGESLTLSDEVLGMYGVEAEWTEETRFEEALREIEDLLPGAGRIAERLQAFTASTELPANTAIEVIQDVMQHMREATRRWIELPAGERCDVAIVQDKPWRAYNHYLGAGKSRVEFCTDVPIPFLMIPRLVAHEAYPGHHTENAVKESGLLLQAGQVEACLHLANAPSCVLAEGIATAAYAAVTPPADRVDLLRQTGARHGLMLPDPEVMEAVAAAFGRLNGVLSNATILLHDGGATDSEILAYLRRYSLATEQEAASGLAFLQDPLWRSYCFTYTAGEGLVQDVMAASRSPQEALAGLLREPAHPAQLRRMARMST